MCENRRIDMGIVHLDKTVSLDGFIAGPNDDVTRLFEWSGGTITSVAEIPSDLLQMTGAVVMGKRSFKLMNSSNAWVTPDSTSLPWQVFVLTSSPQEKVTKGATAFTFVTDGIESAVTQAKAAAGYKNVGVIGAKTAQQCIKAGLLDEVHLHLVPVLLGEGIRLFDYLGTQRMELVAMGVIQALGVTHLSFRVIK